MDNDDLPIGRVLDRREALRLMAAASAAALVGCSRGSAAAVDSTSTVALSSTTAASNATALPGCVVRPELTEGPYFVDNQLNRSDIRTDPASGAAKPGTPLALEFNVSQISNGQCVPLKGAMVDVWHCDANGVYAGVADTAVGFNTVGQKFLRGHQITDDKGVARFTTIYPGWYQGRAVHIHFKIRAPWAPGAKVTDATTQYDFTSQLFFDDAQNNKVFATAPYSSKGLPDRKNQDDGIFRESKGSLLVKLAQADQGYAGRFDVGLDLSDVSIGGTNGGGMGGPGGPPPPRQKKG
ncbi:MAG: intradiol ring-cleavage dioxygenase [Gemmatimonadales bacterium]